MVILTIKAVEHEAQRQLEILERRLELIEAYHDNLITKGELTDALLLLSLRASSGGGEGGNDDV